VRIDTSGLSFAPPPGLPGVEFALLYEGARELVFLERWAPGIEIALPLPGGIELLVLDLFFLHSNVVPDEDHIAQWPDAARRMTPYATFVEHVRPVFERLVGEGLIGAWGLTGIGHPDTIIKLVSERPAPAAVQCIANLLNSPGGLKFFNGPAKPRGIMAAARTNGVGVMGIRAVQAGALTSAIDRLLPADHPEMRDFAKAVGFRRLAEENWCHPRHVGASIRAVAWYRHTCPWR